MRLAAVAAVLAGCVISDDDEPTAAAGDVVDIAEPRMVDVRWEVRSLASQTESGCPVETVHVTTQQVDATGAAVGPERSDPLPCSLGAGGIPFEVDALGGLVATQVVLGSWGASLVETVDVAPGDQRVDFVVFTDAGYLALAWVLTGASCADDEIDAVEVASVGPRSYTETFECEDARGITGALLAGRYDVTIRALSRDDVVAEASVQDVVVGGRNRVTPLGVIDLVAAGP